jgi:TonB family protein
MKKLLFVSTIIMMCTFMFASPAIPPYEVLLKNEIHYPQFAKENHEEGTVLVNFTVDQNGKIRIQQSNSDNEVLRDYVVQKLSALVVPAADTTESEVNMKFIFRLL